MPSLPPQHWFPWIDGRPIPKINANDRRVNHISRLDEERREAIEAALALEIDAYDFGKRQFEKQLDFLATLHSSKPAPRG